MLQAIPILRIPVKGHSQEEKEDGLSGAPITFPQVAQKIKKICLKRVAAGKLTPENNDKINAALFRISCDNALYGSQNFTLSNILIRVWSYIHSNPEKPQSHEKLINIFGLTKKCALSGLKFFNLNSPKKPNGKTLRLISRTSSLMLRQ